MMSLALAPMHVLAGTLANITIDGSFADWAGVPIANSDPTDSSAIDIADVQIANDAANLYLRITYHTPVNPNTGPSLYLAFDTDNNVASGFNIYSLGTVGSEAGFQSDFPFDQRTGFNVGGLSAGATISPIDFGNPANVVSSQEYSIPRNLTFVNGGQTVFGNSFTLMLWTDSSVAADVTGGMGYEFAAVPEPTMLAGLGAVGLLSLRRRKVR
jgi:hypothetical protein